MAFLAPLAAKGVAAGATTAAATTPLAAGLKLGTTIGLKAPTAFAFAPNIGGAGSQLLTGGSLLAPSTGGGLGSLLGAGGAGLKATPFLAPGAGGLGGALTPTGLASLKMPAGSLLKGGTTLAGPSQLAGQAGNISNQMYSELANQFARPNLGQGFTQLGSNLAGPADLATKTGLDMSKGLIGQKAQFKAAQPLAKTGPGTISEKLALKPTIDPKQNFLSNFGNLIQNPSIDAAGDYLSTHPVASMAAGYGLYNAMKSDPKAPPQGVSLIRPYEFDYNPNAEAYATSPTVDSREQTYFDPVFTAQTPYEAPGPEYKKAASGGITKAYAIGGPVETMAAMNAVGANTGYPMAGINTAMYSNPMVQRPEAVNVISPSGDAGVAAYSGEPKFAKGGISDLGDYSDGGRLLKGPGDGVSDSIPAVIGKRQPARLADGEFVIPARIVSELGNGSTEAGARKLYAMMERIQNTRKKSIGKKKVAVNSKADKHLPA